MTIRFHRLRVERRGWMMPSRENLVHEHQQFIRQNNFLFLTMRGLERERGREREMKIIARLTASLTLCDSQTGQTVVEPLDRERRLCIWTCTYIYKNNYLFIINYDDDFPSLNHQHRWFHAHNRKLWHAPNIIKILDSNEISKFFVLPTSIESNKKLWLDDFMREVEKKKKSNYIQYSIRNFILRLIEVGRVCIGI